MEAPILFVEMEISQRRRSERAGPFAPCASRAGGQHFHTDTFSSASPISFTLGPCNALPNTHIIRTERKIINILMVVITRAPTQSVSPRKKYEKKPEIKKNKTKIFLSQSNSQNETEILSVKYCTVCQSAYTLA